MSGFSLTFVKVTTILVAFVAIPVEGVRKQLCAQWTELQCQPPILYGKYQDPLGNEHETFFDEEDPTWGGWIERSVGPAAHYFSLRPTQWCAPFPHEYGTSGYHDPSNPVHSGWDEHWEHAWVKLSDLYVMCGRNPPNIC